MLLSTQTHILVEKLGYDEALKTFSKAGFDALDLSLFSMQRENDIFSGNDAVDNAKELRKKAEALGLSFNQAHAPFSFDLKSATFDDYTPLVEKSIRVAAAAGVKQIIVHPFHQIVYKGNEQMVFEKNLAYYRGFVPLCEELGIKVCAENMWQKDAKRGYIVEDACSYATEFARYLDAIDSPWIIGCLDIGHCGLVGEEPQDAIRILGHDRVKALHVHDNDYKSDAHTIPGCGKINWAEVTKALADINYSGEFTYEADNFFLGFDGFYQEAADFLALRGRKLISMIEAAKA
ncbi:MAG: sugar phosphate isomerase/epimerase [Clostridia bacterium]|nr:sugar phosphate isomerase/epimerase [Clostridia bacterium]